MIIDCEAGEGGLERPVAPQRPGAVRERQETMVEEVWSQESDGVPFLGDVGNIGNAVRLAAERYYDTGDFIPAHIFAGAARREGFTIHYVLRRGGEGESGRDTNGHHVEYVYCVNDPLNPRSHYRIGLSTPRRRVS